MFGGRLGTNAAYSCVRPRSLWRRHWTRYPLASSSSFSNSYTIQGERLRRRRGLGGTASQAYGVYFEHIDVMREGRSTKADFRRALLSVAEARVTAGDYNILATTMQRAVMPETFRRCCAPLPQVRGS